MAEIDQQKLAALLTKAQIAHHDFESVELGGTFDEQWPQWYAQYVADNGVASLLGAEPDLDRLATQLNEINEQHKTDRTAEPWAEYAAHVLLKSTG